MKPHRWVIVTGASSGIGESITNKLLANGVSVIVTARKEEKLRTLYEKEEDVKIISWDLSKTETIKDYVKTVKEQVGAISGLVHCAGIQVTEPIYLIKESKLQEIFNINTFAAMMLIGAFSKRGMSATNASFVLISSLAAHEGAFGKSIYAASKGALEGFVKAATPELAEKNIRINVIAPGVIQTPMVKAYFAQLTKEQRQTTIKEYPLGLGEPEDISEMAAYLLDEKSKWITGQTIIMDGGHLTRKC